MLLLCLAVMNGQAEQRLKLRPPSRCEESPADAGLSCFGADSEGYFGWPPDIGAPPGFWLF